MSSRRAANSSVGKSSRSKSIARRSAIQSHRKVHCSSAETPSINGRRSIWRISDVTLERIHLRWSTLDKLAVTRCIATATPVVRYRQQIYSAVRSFGLRAPFFARLVCSGSQWHRRALFSPRTGPLPLHRPKAPCSVPGLLFCGELPRRIRPTSRTDDLFCAGRCAAPVRF